MYVPSLPIGGPYLRGYGALQDQFPLVYDVSFLLNYYGKNTVLSTCNTPIRTVNAYCVVQRSDITVVRTTIKINGRPPFLPPHCSETP